MLLVSRTVPQQYSAEQFGFEPPALHNEGVGRSLECSKPYPAQGKLYQH